MYGIQRGIKIYNLIRVWQKHAHLSTLKRNWWIHKIKLRFWALKQINYLCLFTHSRKNLSSFYRWSKSTYQLPVTLPTRQIPSDNWIVKTNELQLNSYKYSTCYFTVDLRFYTLLLKTLITLYNKNIHSLFN